MSPSRRGIAPTPPGSPRWLFAEALYKADGGTLGIREQRHIDGTRPVPFRKLRRAANIHQRPLLRPQLLDREGSGVSHA